jgi:hypothetical protein
MKITQALGFSLAVSVLAATSVFAQGKGGGGGNAGGGGNPGKGGGFDKPSSPAAARPSAPDSTPGRSSDHAADDDGNKGKGYAKGHPSNSASSAAHGLATSMHEINQTAFAQRRELHNTLDMRLKSSRDALKQIQSEAKAARVDARSDFKAALDDVKVREKDLGDALKASNKATEANWNTNRDALARAYQAHADAMTRLEKLPRLPRP